MGICESCLVLCTSFVPPRLYTLLLNAPPLPARKASIAGGPIVTRQARPFLYTHSPSLFLSSYTADSSRASSPRGVASQYRKKFWTFLHAISKPRAKEIPTSTKLEILEDLEARAKWEAQAKTMAQEYPLATLIRLLHSPEVTIVEAVCSLLGSLAMWKSVNAEVALLNTRSHLIPLAIPSNGVPLKQSVYALSGISIWETGVRALAEVNIHELAALLDSDDPDILKHPSAPVQQGALYALHCCVPEATEQTEDSSTGTSVERPFHLLQTMASRRVDLPFLPALISRDIDLVKGAMAELEHISSTEPGAINLVNCHLEPFLELLDLMLSRLATQPSQVDLNRVEVESRA
ncbi:hypothetical protein FB451DRAFT_1167688 [Mycena latifolia]|nr:hypothetical protein FB451DRAFT_1167688 [Mycena latifolia]